MKSVLELRRREEGEAARCLTDAARRRTEAEALAAHRDAEVAVAEDRVRAAAVAGGGETGGSHLGDGAERSPSRTNGITGVDAATQARFVARLRDELVRVQAARAAFRSGPLREAREAETLARDQAVAARQRREAFGKHEARFDEAARRSAERRAEDARDDVARAVRHHRSARDS